MTKLYVAWTAKFKRDYKLAMRRGYNIELLDEVIRLLAHGEILPGKYRDHQLAGNWRGCRECHITPDWLLIYKIDGETLVLTLTRTGTHGELFGK